jgi:DNA-directed RNA polymerase alpha subunit
MKKIEKVEDLYAQLDESIDQFTNENINKKQFEEIIDQLNQNEFGIKIDKNLVPDNRETFNEQGMVSYPYDDESSSY